MNSDSPRSIGLSDLAQLTLRANVVFAVRCAQRIRPCFELAGDAPRRDEQLVAVDGAITAAVAFCQDLEPRPGQAAIAAASASVVADETCTFTRFAGYAAVRAAEAAGYAEAYVSNPSEAAIVDVVAAAFGAGRVLAANADGFTLGLVVAALISDFDNLQRLAPGTSQDLGPPIDPSETGPLGSLWPLGRPGWIGEIDAARPTIFTNFTASACR